MDIKKLEAIMKLMRKHHVAEVSLEEKETGEKLQIISAFGQSGGGYQALPYSALTPAPMPEPAGGSHHHEVEKADDAGESVSGIKLKPNQKLVRSPFVGTFYSSPSPGAEVFSKVGQKVKKGDVLCIVEAMKLMNEIEAEFDGIIVDILVKNEQPVEYNQPIFIME